MYLSCFSSFSISLTISTNYDYTFLFTFIMIRFDKISMFLKPFKLVPGAMNMSLMA